MTNNTLIHVGLHKTATTSMQQMWNDDPRINLSHKFMVALRDQLLQAFINNTAFSVDQIQGVPLFHSQSEDPNAYTVFSNEGFSTFNWLNTATPDALNSFFDAQAAVMKSIVPEAHILLVVRNPVDWIRSMYNQHINAGGTENFSDFINQYSDGLKQILALNPMLSSWENHFGINNVHIMPFELFRDAPDKFCTLLNEKTNCPIVNAHSAASKNTSITGSRQEFMRESSDLFDFISSSDIFDPENKPIIQQVFNLVKQSIRVELSDNPDGPFAQDVDSRSSNAETKQPITPALADFITEKFIPLLAKKTGYLSGYLDEYAPQTSDISASKDIMSFSPPNFKSMQ